MKTADITDIVRLVVEAMGVTINVSSIVDNENGTYTLNTSCTQWINPADIFTVNEVVYTVQSYEIDESLTVKPEKKLNVVPSFSSFELKAPYFFQGTPISTNLELVGKKNTQNKTPLVWLMKPITEKFNDFKDSLERTSDVRLFFMDESKLLEWTTQQHHDQVIKPTRRMADRFIELIESTGNSKTFARHEGYDTVDHANFGVFITNQGYKKNLLDDKFSGIEMKISLKIRKQKCHIVICN